MISFGAFAACPIYVLRGTHAILQNLRNTPTSYPQEVDSSCTPYSTIYKLQTLHLTPYPPTPITWVVVCILCAEKLRAHLEPRVLDDLAGGRRVH